MKRELLIFAAFFFLIGTAHALESNDAVQNLQEPVAVEPLWSENYEKPSCPKGFVLAKKFCWSREKNRYELCGYICSKLP